MQITFKGWDSWHRPVYENNSGKLFVDVEPRKNYAPELCTKQFNTFNGEPLTPITAIEKYKGEHIEFIPERQVW